MDAKRFKNILEIGETVAVEFKRCREGVKEDTYETICSFLNRFGGDIYLGVEDDGTVLGVPQNSVQNIIKNIISMMNNPEVIYPTVCISPESFVYEGKDVIQIHIPASSEVHTYKKVIYDRVKDADVRITATGAITMMYIRKQNIFTERKVFPYVDDEDIRFDLFPKIRMMAVNRRPDHPWKDMSDKDIIRSAKLYSKDAETGKWGYNLAAVMLLGKDEIIGSVCPAYCTDALLRKVNVDRYDDRLIVETNIIESYDPLMGFARKHMLDKFYLEGDARVSLSSVIAREIIVNSLMHREYTSTYRAKFIIEKDRMLTENANRASGAGEITPDNFEPNSKNPIIASFFTNIGYSDEMGSGTRNLFRSVRAYSGKYPQMTDGDIFRTIVPIDDGYSLDARARNSNNWVTAADLSGLKPLEAEVYKAIAEGRYTTAENMAVAIGSSAITVKRATYRLRDMNLIHRAGSDKKGVWELKG